MKLKEILSIVCFICLGFSCSMENDTIMNDMEKGNTEAMLEGDAYLSFRLTALDSKTKSTGTITPGGTDNSLGQNIKDCSLIVFDAEGKIVNLKNQMSVIKGNDNTYTTSDKIIVKMREGMQVMVIANSTNNFNSCTDIASVKTAIQEIEEFTEDNLTKVSEVTPITWTIKGTSSTKEVEVQTIDITVTQLTASIQFAAFNVIWGAGKKVDVGIKSITLKNINHKSQTVGEESSEPSYKNETLSFTSETGLAYSSSSQVSINPFKEKTPVFYSFQNTNSEQPVCMEIVFTVGEKVFTKEYVINRPNSDDMNNSTKTKYVNPNNIYRLTVNMKVTNEYVDCDVVCYTEDWVHNEWNVPGL